MIKKKVFKVTDSISKRISIPVVIPTEDIQNKIDNIQTQANEIEDELDGGITSDNVTEYRNTYVFNNDGILDATHDLIVDFELIDEMTKLVECKVSFWVKDFISGVKDV